MSIADVIKNARYKLCMTQSEFAQMIGVAHSTISAYELGVRFPGFRNTRKIVKTLMEKGIEIKLDDLKVYKHDC